MHSWAWRAWLVGALAAVAACGSRLPTPAEPTWSEGGVFRATSRGWEVVQLRSSSVVGSCGLVAASPEAVDHALLFGPPKDLDPELQAVLHEEQPQPAWGAFCAFRKREGCCYQARDDDLIVGLASRSPTSLVIKLRTFPAGDVLEPLAEHARLPQTLRELTILLETGGYEDRDIDLAPLGKLHSLEHLTIAGLGTVESIDPLLSLPSLVDLDVGWLKLSPADRATLRGQDRIRVNFKPDAAYEFNDVVICPAPAHDLIHATTEVAPEGYHFDCGWPFPG
jgi:hypothetical protein